MGEDSNLPTPRPLGLSAAGLEDCGRINGLVRAAVVLGHENKGRSL